MKQLYKSMLSVVLSVLMLTTSVFASDSGAGTLLRRSHTRLSAGADYYVSTYANGENPQTGYTLEIGPNSGLRPVLTSCDTVWGGRTLDWMLEYAAGQGLNVAAAVNTSFFHGPGVPIGIVVENGVLKSAANESDAFAVLPDGGYYAARDAALDITLTDGSGRSYAVPRLNKLLSGDDLHLYTADYSSVSTRIDEDVWAVRLQRLEGDLTLNGQVSLQVTEVLDSVQEVPIGAEYMILTARREGTKGEDYSQFHVGDVFTLTVHCPDETLRHATQVTGCGDILVADGIITDHTQWNAWITGPNPRTLLGWKPDGTLVVHVADGRNPDYSVGLTLRQAAEEMLRLGCSWAVNMDGGGSSVMGARLPGSGAAAPVSRPSDGAQRADAAYLLLVSDAKPDGVARYWHLKENNYYVLPGQRVPLRAYATDRGLGPAVGNTEGLFYALGEEISQTPVVTAPDAPGSHWVNVWGNGASGGGTLHVVNMPTNLTVHYEYEDLPKTLTLERGRRLALDINASHQGMPLYVDATAARFSQSVYLGTVDERGVFTARAPHGTTGTLTVRLGGYTYEILLTVVDSKTDPSQNKIKTALDWYSIFR